MKYPLSVIQWLSSSKLDYYNDKCKQIVSSQQTYANTRSLFELQMHISAMLAKLWNLILI